MTYCNLTTACALSVALTLAVGTVPCRAAGGLPPGKSLSTFSPATLRLVTASAPQRAAKATDQAPDNSSGDSGSFLSSTKGRVAFVLMLAGAGLVVWSANHDRQPVKSPVR